MSPQQAAVPDSVSEEEEEVKPVSRRWGRGVRLPSSGETTRGQGSGGVGSVERGGGTGSGGPWFQG